MSAKKMGRPTANPKNTKITIRIDDEVREILDNYCKKKCVSRTTAITDGIRKLEK